LADTKEFQLANPGALGLAGFGFNTILLQLHNLGLIESAIPLAFGFIWGGTCQIIAGIIDARRGDTFGLTAFTSYGAFWIGLSLYFLLSWNKTIVVDNSGLGWLMVIWGIFTAYMFIGTLKMTAMHAVVFGSLTVLFGLLAAVFFGAISSKIAGWEGLFCGASAVYGSIAIIWKEKYGRWILPLGQLGGPSKQVTIKNTAKAT
jgi:succinate-acetate transporter protein